MQIKLSENAKNRLGWATAVILGIAVLVLGLVAFWPKHEPPDGSGDTDASNMDVGQVAPSAVKKPEPPGEAEQVSPAGVEATVRYYFDAVNYLQRTGDNSVLSRIVSPNCGFCSDLNKGIQNAQSSGKRIDGGEYTITNVENIGIAETVEGNKFALPRVSISREKDAVIDKQGKIVDAQDQSTGALDISLAHDGYRWIITEIE